MNFYLWRFYGSFSWFVDFWHWKIIQNFDQTSLQFDDWTSIYEDSMVLFHDLLIFDPETKIRIQIIDQTSLQFDDWTSIYKDFMVLFHDLLIFDPETKIWNQIYDQTS